MKQHNFIVGPCDTDSISFCKSDMTPYSEEELDNLLKQINEISPDFIEWESDGYYKKCLVLKAKNYVLVDFNNKKTTKGSSLIDQKRPKIYLQFMEEVVDLLLDERPHEVNTLYKKYVKLANNITDIEPWCKKLTITDKILNCKGHEKLSKDQLKARGLRANETKVYDALKGRHVQEGDKIYVYFQEDRSIALLSDFNGNYSKLDMIKGLYSCLKVFQNVLDISQFVNYSLKKNVKLIEEL